MKRQLNLTQLAAGMIDELQDKPSTSSIPAIDTGEGKATMVCYEKHAARVRAVAEMRGVKLVVITAQMIEDLEEE